MTPADLLRQRIAESGMTTKAFADRVLLRGYRTVRRWRSGEGEVPPQVVRWLRDPWTIWPVEEDDEIS